LKLHQLRFSSSIAVNLAVAAFVLGLIFMASITLFRESLSVSIDKMLPTVDLKRTEETIESKDISKRICTDAGVSWTFKCETQMKYSCLERAKLGNGWTVTIRIEEISMRLSLPITMTLPVKSPLRLQQHNEGHVIICKRVYANAEQYAKEASYPIFKRTYTADGQTVDEACANAVGVANNELIEGYKQKSQLQTQSISDTYDLLELSRPPSFEHSVEKAVELSKAGQGRRL
jgi:hypothetical protein